MSLTQTYYVASTARSKLGREASRQDHNLRLLVGHANLLDSLMVELADAEREQEAWFNRTVRKASRPEQPAHVRWIDTIVELDDDEDDDSDSDLESEDGSDIDDEDAELFNIPLRKIRSPPAQLNTIPLEDDEDEMDLEEDDEQDAAHALTRVTSKHSPPELLLDSDSESEEDESMPPSPEPTPASFVAAITEKQRQALTSTTVYNVKSQQDLEDYLSQQPLIAAC